MKKSLFLSTIIGVSALLAGCGSSMQLEDYAANAPKAPPVFNFKQFYNGRLKVEGIIQDRQNRVTQRFSETITAHWNGDQGTLEDVMVSDNGRTDKRTWHVRQVSPDHFVFNVDGVIGQGNAWQSGGGLRMAYVFAVPANGTTYNLTFDDRSWLLPDGSLMNKVDMSKLGVTVGHLTAVIRKVPN